MRRLLRWIGIVFGSLVGLVIVAYAVLYFLSERILGRTYAVPAVTLSVPTDPESIQEGRRLATIRGCVNGCHGKDGEGRVMFDDPKIARVVAPNLTAAARQYSDAQLAAFIRHGVRPDGRSLIIMPSPTFNALNDADLGRIIAFMKSLPQVAGPGPSVSVGPLGRIGLVTRKFKMEAELVADAAQPSETKDPEAQTGRYLAQTICSECHGARLRGGSNPEFTSPDLRMVNSYSPEAFTSLLRTGVAIGDRKLLVMGEKSRRHLSHLTDPEIASLYRYLHALPEKE